MKFTHRVIVAYWESNKVEIFGFNRPEDRMTSQFLSPPLPSLPQSLLLFNFGTNQQPGEDYHPYLLVGLCNGSVASFSYTVENKEAKLSDRKIVANLGPSPVFLTPCIVDGQNVVFASGSRGSLLSWQNQRIRNSTLLLKVCRPCSLKITLTYTLIRTWLLQAN
jgi:DNA damage-binding protein 1